VGPFYFIEVGPFCLIVHSFIIDLTNIHGENSAFLQTAAENIRREVGRLYSPGMDIEKTRHISLFALAPMPLLIYLGWQLGNKIPVELYQRHRDTEDWTWKAPDGQSVVYEFRLLKKGTKRSNVALILSLSGIISTESLPPDIDDSFYIYEITLVGLTPAPTFLRTKEALMGFKNIYQSSLRAIMRDHGTFTAMHLFPAVPAPIAVLCGRELLSKVDPTLRVYDYDKTKVGFNFALEVN
jgi:hypothetical protein